jgi:hypothetical protein
MKLINDFQTYIHNDQLNIFYIFKTYITQQSSNFVIYEYHTILSLLEGRVLNEKLR